MRLSSSIDSSEDDDPILSRVTLLDGEDRTYRRKFYRVEQNINNRDALGDGMIGKLKDVRSERKTLRRSSDRQKKNTRKLLVGLACLLSTFSSTAYPQVGVPVVTFKSSCAYSREEFTRSIIEFAELSKRYEAQAVYINIEIAATANSGFCSILDVDMANEPQLLPDDFGITASKIELGGFVLWARSTSRNAGVIKFSIGSLENLPIDGLYEGRTRYQNLYSYSGMGVLRHSTGNGWEYIEFHPIQDSHLYWRQIQEAIDSN
jgi:hypothetical protein